MVATLISYPFVSLFVLFSQDLYWKDFCPRLVCGDSLDRIKLVVPLLHLRLYRFFLIFAKTLARSKMMNATLFLSPSFLYLCRFLFVSKGFRPGLARLGLVTRYACTELWVNRV